ncbi:hypothetical protein M404DRAFT_1003181, partial [Pisolithus tinctorius Marx 270]
IAMQLSPPQSSLLQRGMPLLVLSPNSLTSGLRRPSSTGAPQLRGLSFCRVWVWTANMTAMRRRVYDVTACEIKKRAEMDAECPLL